MPYSYVSATGAGIRADIAEAIRWAIHRLEWESPFEFIKKEAFHRDYLYFYDAGPAIQGACGSQTGRQRGAQAVYVANCTPGTMLHEIMHALGFRHEHQRADRNQSIRVIWGNVTLASQFSKKPANGHWSSGEYDYRSVMHYRPNQFSNGGPTLVAVDSNGDDDTSETLGPIFYSGFQRRRLTDIDKDALNRMCYGTAHSIKLSGALHYAQVKQYKWSYGWTSAAPYRVGGKGYVLLYKNSTGRMEVHKIKSNGVVDGRIQSGTWSYGYDMMIPFSTGRGKHFVFMMNHANGKMVINKIKGNGTVGAAVQRLDWSAKWTSAGFFRAGVPKKTYLFLLKRDGGRVLVKKVKSNGMVEPGHVDERDWTSGWSIARPFSTATGGNFLFLFRGSRIKSKRQVKVHKLDSNGKIGRLVFRSKWGTRWTDAKFMRVGAVTFVYLFERVSNRALVKRVSEDGKMKETCDKRTFGLKFDFVEPYKNPAGAFVLLVSSKDRDK